jgi:hypothetical protein
MSAGSSICECYAVDPETDHSFPINVKIESAWRCASILLYNFVSWYKQNFYTVFHELSLTVTSRCISSLCIQVQSVFLFGAYCYFVIRARIWRMLEFFKNFKKFSENTVHKKIEIFKNVITIEPLYNDISLYDTLSTASDILLYQSIPHC